MVRAGFTWASLAQAEQVEQLVLGTELAGTIGHERQWHRTIADARAAYAGELTYAASWDEAALVPFWPLLDVVGVDFYYPVADRADPSRFELLSCWQPWLDRLRLLHEQTGRPILLTELGYRSVDGAGRKPYKFTSAPALDLAEQADLYGAALTALAGRDWLVGVYWWNWPANAQGGPEDADYTPRGKPALAELAAAWR